MDALVALWDYYTLISAFPSLKFDCLLYRMEIEGISVVLITLHWPSRLSYTDRVSLLALLDFWDLSQEPVFRSGIIGMAVEVYVLKTMGI